MSGEKHTADILNAAADLLEKPGAWTQDEFARDAAGREVHWADHHAVCWCARGAIAAVACPDPRPRSLHSHSPRPLHQQTGGPAKRRRHSKGGRQVNYRFDTPRFHDELKDRAMRSHRHSGASYHIPEQDHSGAFWTVVCVAGFLAFCGLCALAGMA